MKSPIKHCNATILHSKEMNEMRNRTSKLSGRGTGNKTAMITAKKARTAPFKLTDESYEKSNRKMRSEYKSETGKTLGSRQTSGTGKRRISFACRFAGMKGGMKDANGSPSKLAMALKKWGFGSKAAAASFCRKHKKS